MTVKARRGSATEEAEAAVGWELGAAGVGEGLCKECMGGWPWLPRQLHASDAARAISSHCLLYLQYVVTFILNC